MQITQLVDEVEAGSGWRDQAKAVLVVESIAIGISLASPLVPSKTGSTWSPADLFATDPNYLQKVVATFVVVHMIVAILGIVTWAVSKVGQPE